mgnify:CR=1 FL=1
MTIKFGRSLRHFFVTMVVNGMIGDPKTLWEEFTDELGNTCDLETQDPEFHNERGWAEIIIQHIRTIKQPYRLDRLTKGNGSCLMIALMQQLRREDIYLKARPEVQELARTLDHREFRKRVKLFTTRTEDPRLRELKDHYNNSAEPKTWNQYWEDMLGVTWADHYFIRASAIYLEFNIEIITTSTTKEHPSIAVPCGLPGKETLWIGNITDLHYQSILKIHINHESMSHENLPTNDSRKLQNKLHDKDSTNQKSLEECPICKKSFEVLNRHLNKKATCKAQISSNVRDAIRKKAKQKADQNRKDNQARRKAESRQRKKDLGQEEEIKQKNQIHKAKQSHKKNGYVQNC